jgi:hypothetical protein
MFMRTKEYLYDFFQAKRLGTFNDHLLIIAEGFVAWHCAIKGVKETPLSNHAYGAVSLYCYYNTLHLRHELFTYLCEDQDSILRDFKKKILATAAGRPLFTDDQLQNLTMLLPGADLPGQTAVMPEPCQLSPDGTPLLGNPSSPALGNSTMQPQMNPKRLQPKSHSVLKMEGARDPPQSHPSPVHQTLPCS